MFKILRTVLFCAVMLSIFSMPAATEAKSTLSAGTPELKKEPVTCEYRDPVTGYPCVKTSYDRIRVKNKARYGMLDAAIESEHNAFYDSRLAEILEETKEVAQQVNRATGGQLSFAAEETAGIIRSDSKLVSIYGNLYTFLGGPHPDIHHYGWNFAPATGERVWLKDAVAEPERLIEASLRAFKRLEREKGVQYDSDSPDSLKGMLQKELYEGSSHEVQWTMDETGGLRLYFDAGVFGGYAAGPVELFLPGNRGLVKAEYRRKGM